MRIALKMRQPSAFKAAHYFIIMARFIIVIVDMNDELSEVGNSLDAALEETTKLEQLVKCLNGEKAEDLELITNSSQYLDLLGTLLYSLNCTVHSYAHIKSLPVPQQFNSVKECYNKVKDALVPQESDAPSKKVNKQVVDRIIQRHT